MTNAAVYVRVSTEDQVEGVSLDVQRARCRAYIDRQDGWVFVGEYADEGVSGVVFPRPGLDGLMAACERHLVDVVVVSRLDRFGRSVRQLAASIGKLDDLGVQFVSVSEAFDSMAPAGRLQRNILSSIAQFEREEMLERQAIALRAKVRAGWWPGGPPPYGFALERVGRYLKLVIDEQETATLLRATELVVDEGKSTVEAAAILNLEGRVPRRSPGWTHGNLLHQLLAAPMSGTWRYGRTRDSGRRQDIGIEQVPIPAIMTVERHMALVERLRRYASGPQNPDHRSFFELSRGILISACGQNCNGYSSFDKGSGSRTYRCLHSYAEGIKRCDCKHMSAPIVEAKVWTEVSGILRLSLTSPVDDADPLLPTATRRLDRLRSEIATLEHTLSRVAVEFVSWDLDPAAVRAATTDMTAGLTTLRSEYDRLRASTLMMTNEAPRWNRIRDVARRVIDRLDDLTPQERRAVLTLLNVKARVTGYHECHTCDGTGRGRGHGKNYTCPDCLRKGSIPHLAVAGIWMEGT